MMKYGRKDGNQGAIQEQIDERGWTFQDLSALGDGAPDIIVGAYGYNFLFEIKNPEKPPSQRKLTDAQRAFHDLWTGQVDVVTTFNEMEAIIEARVHPKM